jgi:ATP-dependent Clp protease ATP-binding subunit ClpB
MEGVTVSGEIRDSDREAVMREMRSHFRPEFLNRVDDIVLFKTLSLDEIKQIVGLQVEDLQRRLDEHRIHLKLSDAAAQHVAEAGYDPVYGARPLKRYLQRELETRIGRAIVAGEVLDGSVVTVDLEDDKLTIHTEAPEPAAAEE